MVYFKILLNHCLNTILILDKKLDANANTNSFRRTTSRFADRKSHTYNLTLE